MADNYLERKMEEYRNASSLPMGRTLGLDALLKRNRSTRGFDSAYVMNGRQLRAMVSVCDKIASAKNRQILRFHIAVGDRAKSILPLVKMGAALPLLHLPLPGTEPNAFIVICSDCPESPYYEFDEGIAAQSILLKAVEMGFNGLIVKAFDRDKLRSVLGLELLPTTVIAIGKSAEKAELVAPGNDGSLAYYREDGVHKVPKIPWEKLIV